MFIFMPSELRSETVEVMPASLPGSHGPPKAVSIHLSFLRWHNLLARSDFDHFLHFEFRRLHSLAHTNALTSRFHDVSNGFFAYFY
jgi:hypothetical protein